MSAAQSDLYFSICGPAIINIHIPRIYQIMYSVQGKKPVTVLMKSFGRPMHIIVLCEGITFRYDFFCDSENLIFS